MNEQNFTIKSNIREVDMTANGLRELWTYVEYELSHGATEVEIKRDKPS